MRIWRAWRKTGSRVRELAGFTVAVVAASAGLVGTTAAIGTPAAPAAVAAPDVSAATCAALTGLSLPDLPGHDTAAVTAAYVAGSGCQVGIEITDTSDPRGGQPGMIGIDLTLPDDWNGNYMAEGNGVYCSPATFVTLTSDQWLAAGYAISQDDCGHTGYLNALVSPWVTNTNPPPALNWNRIDDFGYLAQHLTAVESKVVIGDYYGARAHYSFWNGCSTGGRQGLMEAQRYPSDFNGILAGAPALNWDQFMVAQMWPQLVMEWNKDVLPTCKENLVNTTLQAKCHDQDGQVDGVFDPRTCNVLGVLHSLIGTSTPCGTFTAADALVVQEIWQGPRYSGSQSNLLTGLPVWFGMEPGANLAGLYVPALGPGGGLGLATTYQQANGQWAGAPFIPSAEGLADQLIFTGDSISYYNHVLAANGGIQNTGSFFRYFLAPGVGHCGSPGAGSIAPANPMQQVIDWVENGQAPAVLNASGTINGQAVTRPLCPYPDPDAIYTGGNPNLAASYTCNSRPQYTNPFLLNGQHG